MGTHGSDDQFDIPMGEAPNRDRPEMGSPGGQGRVVEDGRGNAQGRPHATPPGAGLKQLLPDLATRCGPNAVRERRRRPEPEPAVAGDRDESRGGEEPRTVQGRGVFSKRSAISQTKGTGAGGGPPAQPASNEAGRDRNGHDNGPDRRHRGHHPRGPGPLEGRSTRSQHGSSSGGSRVVHGIQECTRELPDRGVHGQPVVREHDHGLSAKRGAERPVVAPALVAAGAPLNARLRAGGMLPARGC